jgi:uncharacterized LabA/DUF88 family protein
MASKLDAVILATGDGDFVPLVEYIKAQGCQVEIIAFGRSASARLKEAADEFVDMDNDPGTFLIGRRQGSDTRGGGNNILVSGADQE